LVHLAALVNDPVPRDGALLTQDGDGVGEVLRGRAHARLAVQAHGPLGDQPLLLQLVEEEANARGDLVPGLLLLEQGQYDPLQLAGGCGRAGEAVGRTRTCSGRGHVTSPPSARGSPGSSPPPCAGSRRPPARAARRTGTPRWVAPCGRPPAWPAGRW